MTFFSVEEKYLIFVISLLVELKFFFGLNLCKSGCVNFKWLRDLHLKLCFSWTGAITFLDDRPLSSISKWSSNLQNSKSRSFSLIFYTGLKNCWLQSLFLVGGFSISLFFGFSLFCFKYTRKKCKFIAKSCHRMKEKHKKINKFNCIQITNFKNILIWIFESFFSFFWIFVSVLCILISFFCEVIQ